jgi:21S rRNA (uridine2791-2'-O)-methyltransferase
LTTAQVVVERTKPTGRVIGIDIIPAQPPKGVSTIQGNFLSKGVQDEVKRFLSDPERGRPRQQLYYSTEEQPETERADLLHNEHSYIEMERQTDPEKQPESKKTMAAAKRERGKGDEDVGKMVDVVISDMSAPFEQVTGFWKRSLTSPYIRMMNTSGINFKDHAGSMVCTQWS